jgi:hypothetical protein
LLSLLIYSLCGLRSSEMANRMRWTRPTGEGGLQILSWNIF